MKWFYISIIFIFISTSCNDIVSLAKMDVEKYAWLYPFLPDSNFVFKNGSHDTDSGVLEFLYESGNVLNAKVVLSRLDTIAQNQEWAVVEKQTFSRVYIKPIQLYPAYNKDVRIVIKVVSISNTIEYKIYTNNE